MDYKKEIKKIVEMIELKNFDDAWNEYNEIRLELKVKEADDLYQYIMINDLSK